MRKLSFFLVGLLTSLGIITGATVAIAQSGFGIQPANLWKRVSGAILPIVSTDTIGSSGTRVAKGWFTDLDTLAMSIGGVVTGNMEVSGYTSTTRIQTADGTAAAPSHTFTDDTNTGMYRVGADQLGFSAGGFHVASATASGLSVSGTVALPLGSNSAPSISFGQANTGIYSSSLGSALAYTVNGTARIVMDTAALRPATDNALTLGTSALRFSTGNFATVSSSVALVDRGAAATPSIRLGDADTGLYNNSGLVAITSDGTLAAQFANTGSYMNSHLLTQTPNTYDLGSSSWTWRDAYIARQTTTTNLMVSGVATSTRFAAYGVSTVPQFNFSSDQGTGIGLTSAGVLDLYVGFGTRARLSSTDLVSLVNITPNSANLYSLGRSTLPWQGIYAGLTSSTSALIGNPGALNAGVLGVGAATSSLYTMVVQSPSAGSGAIQILSGTGYEIVASNTLDIQSVGDAKLGSYPSKSVYLYSNGAEANAQFRLESSGNQITMRPGGASVISAEFNSTSSVFNVTTTIASAYFTAPNLNALGATGDFLCQNNSTGNIEVQLANCTVSSIRFKEHVQSMSAKKMMEKTRKLRAVMFDYKNGDTGMLGTSKDHGFIAEEVAMIDPYLVVWEEATPEGLAEVMKRYPKAVMDRDGKKFIPRTVDYMKVSVILSGAIQDLDERLQKLEVHK